ncbi:MAG: NAD(P)/FAD-dependent oxidoreductase [Gemmatimonadales bacterium]|nr:MAG: NAD(P)/FAD-dependent oxidoreductase [Gemmatimonadales bacterium]
MTTSAGAQEGKARDHHLQEPDPGQASRGWEPRPRVCVIGAGVAGLVTARVLRNDGFRVTVFEREPEPGGVWTSSRSYPGLRANTPREVYSFSDFPYPDGTDDFPTAAQVRGYLAAYADHFGLRPLLELSTEVTSVARVKEAEGDTGSFEVTVSPVGTGDTRCRTFDFVAVCSGTFSIPHVPRLPGRDRFAGSVRHSSRFQDAARFTDQRVVVVGGGRSAMGIAASVAERARSVTLVCRRPHWMMPRYLLGTRMDRLFVTRLAEALLPPYHRPDPNGGEAPRQSTFRKMAAPLLRLWWRGQTRLVPRLAGMPPGMLPDATLPGGLEKSGIGTEFYQALREGQAEVERSGITGFSGPDTLRLETGREIRADVVVLATGWRTALPFLDEELTAEVQQDGRIQLYRRILAPREPRLGFVGFASSTACTITSELGAHWLSQCFRGELDLPSSEARECEARGFDRWATQAFPDRPEGAFIGPYVAHYVDDLMRDMGLPERRKRSRLREYLGPLTAERYRGVADERRQARTKGNAGSHRDA